MKNKVFKRDLEHDRKEIQIEKVGNAVQIEDYSSEFIIESGKERNSPGSISS